MGDNKGQLQNPIKQCLRLGKREKGTRKTPINSLAKLIQQRMKEAKKTTVRKTSTIQSHDYLCK